ncbi:hypothetical protein F441_07163 [Phytophthora nicotianae CJ01A1]|uniref:WRKY19-like zinc finger domain-containing protein n=3 Tax=Phytophthora nicotianae TaxID=4792 RepID=W2ZGR0_PHYNI|nr:hypothetical protein L915_07035 [Phytophthora nicotianae]ETP18650.1 hypothetical protein F441_07163 [Phytophthora nicotianae CJ01A1]ETP46562.1 hypothetical protein F442_07221 [Phytophthora nicotianae P10297]KUF75993.1 WRKY transcription factor 19 [Phytophthora nicotianae]ETL95301.1 hypothetical protein L917_06872 [Phytophthora nicotianae]
MGQGGRGRGRGVGGERCSTAGCNNKAQASGRCRTHTGTLGQCSQPRCEKQAQYKGLCVAHGGRRVCTYPDCSKTVTSKGLCGDHGGGRRKPSGTKRPSVKQDKAVLSTSSGMSMMSLLLNEWPQDVDNGMHASASYTGQILGDKVSTEAVTPLHLPQSLGHSDSTPIPYNGTSNWTVSDAKFSTGSVAVATSSAIPQETQNGSMPHSDAPAWPGDNNVMNLQPLMSAASVMPASVSTSTALPQETQGNESMPHRDAPAWSGDENVTKMEHSVSVMPTSRQSGGSMMSLLLGGWSQDTYTVKTEENSTERDSVETIDSEKSTDKPVKARKRALCTYDGCTKIAQSQGLCVTHGGKRCTHSGCTKSAQYQGLCTTHGGSRACTFPNCVKTVRSAGRCFEHGGGKRCSHSECTKPAKANGLCSSHSK